MSCKIWNLFFLCALLLTLTACGNNNTEEPAQEETVAEEVQTEETGEIEEGSDADDVPQEEVQEQPIQVEPPAEPPANPGEKYMTDFMDMTVGDVTALWGEDIKFFDEWFFGSSKFFFYEDVRVPYTFSYLDPDHKGQPTGSEPIHSVNYAASLFEEAKPVAMVAPNIPADVTFAGLRDLGIEGSYSTEVSEGDELHDGATAYLDYPMTDTYMITFQWLEDHDPETSPVDAVSVIRTAE